MKKINILSLTLVVLLFGNTLSKAQESKTKYNSKQYKKQPIWIDMMNDPNANYYETIKAFREYWKKRSLPKEPFESEKMETFEREVGLLKEGESEKEREREEEKRLKRRKSSELSYAAEVRAFKGWMQNVKPWLREDGSIITPEEQQKIIEKQNQELKEIEKKNGKK